MRRKFYRSAYKLTSSEAAWTATRLKDWLQAEKELIEIDVAA